MKERVYPFTREGLQMALQHKDYIEIAKERLTEHPELFPIALAIVLGVSVILINPMASTVAYKTATDTSIIAFKYLGGF